MKNTPVMIMAGGKGSRLGPLTCHRAKPAVPFGGRYRIIDFVLSNFVNAGYRRIYVLTQYMASSLIRHLSRNWRLSTFNEWIECVPAQMRMGEFWYRGTADSVYQNINLVRDAGSDHIAVFGGDHIYKCAIDQMEAAHLADGADLTVAAFPVPRSEAHRFGVLQIDERWHITGFQEKPRDPSPIPGQPDMCLVSMGNYFFKAGLLVDALEDDAGDSNSSHDFGKDVIPTLLRGGARILAYDFAQNRVPGEPEGAAPYWRDVGTVDSYFEANMDLRSPLPLVNLYNRQWRIHTALRGYPPARFVRHGDGQPADIIDSLVCEGSIVSSARLDRVMVGYDCFVHAGSRIADSVFLSGCDVGAGARLTRVLMDKNRSVEAGTVIGEDPAADAERFPFVTESGVVVLPKGTYVPRKGPVQLAHDMAFLLKNDAANRVVMERFADRYVVAERHRHSHSSAGPRYQRFGPGALSAVDAGEGGS